MRRRGDEKGKGGGEKYSRSQERTGEETVAGSRGSGTAQRETRQGGASETLRLRDATPGDLSAQLGVDGLCGSCEEESGPAGIKRVFPCPKQGRQGDAPIPICVRLLSLRN